MSAEVKKAKLLRQYADAGSRIDLSLDEDLKAQRQSRRNSVRKGSIFVGSSKSPRHRKVINAY